MIPYFTLPPFSLAGQPIHPFTWLVGLGMITAYLLGRRRVRRVGLYEPFYAGAMLWITLGGFLGAHVLEVLAYYPERLRERGPLTLLEVWDGLSSFGGFLGGTVALLLFCRRYRVWALAYLDAMVFGFAPGFVLARAACFVSHDHLGRGSTFMLAVAYPDGPRHNLGLYEMLLAAAISAVLYALPRRPRPVGATTALTLAIYAPGRFLLDTLRTGDRRYLGLTPAQYGCFVLLGLALWLAWAGKRRGVTDSGRRPPDRTPPS